MKAQKYCVVNKRKESCLSVAVTTVDIVLEPLKVVQMMIDADDPDAEWGIWLTPFRGVPVARMFSPFDLVYLDEDYRVVESVELFPAAGLAPFEGQAASALLLPLHTVSSSRTGAGDQLVICAAEEMADQLASATAAAAPAPVLQSAEAPVEQLQDNDDLAPALAEDRSAQQQAAIQPLDEKKAELQPQTPQAQAPRAQTPQAQAPRAQRKDALRARFLRRIEEMAHQQARVFRSTLPAAALRRTEATAEQPGEAGGLAPALASGLQRGAIEPLDKKKKVEFKAHAVQAQAKDSLRARFQRWIAEIRHRLARVFRSVVSAVASWRTKTTAEQPGEDDGLALTGERSELREVAIEPLDEKAGVESKAHAVQAQAKDSLRARFQRWIAEIRHRLARVFRSVVSAVASWRTKATAEQPGEDDGLALAGERSELQEAAIEPLDEKKKVESKAHAPETQHKDSLKIRFARWSDEMAHGLARILISIIPPPAQKAEPAAEQTQGNAGSAPALPGDRAALQQAALEELDEKKKAIPQVQQKDSLKPRLARWTAEMAHELARILISIIPAPVESAKGAAEQPQGKTGSAPALPGDRAALQQAALEELDEKKKAEPKAPEQASLETRFLRWLFPDIPPPERRISDRRASPGLVAYYPNGDTPKAHRIGNISSTGVYLLTEERWKPGTLISLILQENGPPVNGSGERVAIQAWAVRWGEDGIGLSFALPRGMSLRLWEEPRTHRVNETEPEYIVREFRLARALAFLRRICPSAAEEASQLIHEQLGICRVASAVEIALRAEEFLAREPNTERMLAHSDIVLRILEDGSWAEVECVQQLWAGLLATSCTIEGRDESNMVFVDVLSQLTPIHARILIAACRRAAEVIARGGVISSYPLYCTAQEMIKITGTTSLTKIHRALAQLSDLGLVAKSARSSFISYTENAKTTPTDFGLQMYARCNGHRGSGLPDLLSQQDS